MKRGENKLENGLHGMKENNNNINNNNENGKQMCVSGCPNCRN